LCSGYARDMYTYGISILRPALLGIFTSPGTFWESHFTTLWTVKGRFPALQPLSKTKISAQA